ncbi:MAG: SoxR reducing system RseC family protein [Methylococcales bacterium]|nr:SoxR reducing system RseC family protein [Methylococcales bacterium]MBT7108122.1 SoxR reducing system RseC family protein [Methylococcales bacterium]
MLEERVVISKKEHNQVWVRALPTASCSNCQQKSACSTPLIEKLLRKREILVETDLVLESGDQVIIAINEDAFIKGSVVLYVVPIVALLIGAGLGEVAAPYFLGLSLDVLICISGAVSFFLSLFLIHLGLQSFFYKSFPKPVVLRKVN